MKLYQVTMSRQRFPTVFGWELLVHRRGSGLGWGLTGLGYLLSVNFVGKTNLLRAKMWLR